MRQSITSYKEDLFNKYHETGTLHLNVSGLSTMVISKQDTMMHVLGVAIIQTFSLKKGLKKFLTRGKSK